MFENYLFDFTITLPGDQMIMEIWSNARLSQQPSFKDLIYKNSLQRIEMLQKLLQSII